MRDKAVAETSKALEEEKKVPTGGREEGVTGVRTHIWSIGGIRGHRGS